MSTATTSRSHSRGWLDTVAIGASVVCAVHCLLTPVLLVALPVVATSFWVDANFHLWMLGLVLPTSGLAVFWGCRKHKDVAVLGLCVAGLAVLTVMAVYESSAHAAEVVAVGAVSEAGGDEGEAVSGCAVCSGCATAVVGDTDESGEAEVVAKPVLTTHAAINVLGGLLLIGAHGRNFWLCRRVSCDHD